MRTILSKYVQCVGSKILREDRASSGIAVVEAPSGKLALDALRKHSIDLVFLDLMMPEMDGISFLALKRDDPRLSAIPVIVCSALGEKDTLARARDLGAVSYILKPFTVKSVEDKLRQALRSLGE